MMITDQQWGESILVTPELIANGTCITSESKVLQQTASTEDKFKKPPPIMQ